MAEIRIRSISWWCAWKYQAFLLVVKSPNIKQLSRLKACYVGSKACKKRGKIRLTYVHYIRLLHIIRLARYDQQKLPEIFLWTFDKISKIQIVLISQILPQRINVYQFQSLKKKNVCLIFFIYTSLSFFFF